MTLLGALGSITQMGNVALTNMAAIRRASDGYHVAIPEKIDGQIVPIGVRQREIPDGSQENGIFAEFEPTELTAEDREATDWDTQDLFLFS